VTRSVVAQFEWLTWRRDKQTNGFSKKVENHAAALSHYHPVGWLADATEEVLEHAAVADDGAPAAGAAFFLGEERVEATLAALGGVVERGAGLHGAPPPPEASPYWLSRGYYQVGAVWRALRIASSVTRSTV
jgi:hypothetical protein